MQIPSALNATRPAVKPWYAQLWPWLLMLGPFVVLVAGGFTIWLAVTSPDAMVVDDYYVRGKTINQDLRRDQVASAMRLTLATQYVPATGQISGSLRSAGVPLAGKIRLHLTHATLPEKDLHLAAEVGPDGQFSMALPMLERARWQVLVESEQRDWRLNGSWKWPEQQKIDIAAD
jgi:hypothetical protein